MFYRVVGASSLLRNRYKVAETILRCDQPGVGFGHAVAGHPHALERI